MSSFLPMLVSAMMTWAPPCTHEDAVLRVQIASDIDEVVFDPIEKPLFEGEDGRARTALLVASVALDESAYDPRVDDGSIRGDDGDSVCMLQVRVARGRTREGWNAAALVSDRTKCIRAGLHRLAESMKACRSLRGGDKLGGYTHGKCVTPNTLGRRRWDRAFAFSLRKE